MTQQEKTALQREWERVQRRENLYVIQRRYKKDSKLNQLLKDKVPDGLQGTLDKAFSKAFYVTFEKGKAVIEKTYRKGKMENDYMVREYSDKIHKNRKSIQAFSKEAKGAGYKNLLVSGASGIGMGILGVGLPDIVLFTGLMLRSIYEMALSYGFDYTADNEKRFILLVIQGAFAYGDELEQINLQLNNFIEQQSFCETESIDEQINKAASYLSKELLYMKFLQGIPVVGAVGGAYDAIYMKRIVKYADLKYRRRFYHGKMGKEEQKGEGVK